MAKKKNWLGLEAGPFIVVAPHGTTGTVWEVKCTRCGFEEVKTSVNLRVTAHQATLGARKYCKKCLPPQTSGGRRTEGKEDEYRFDEGLVWSGRTYVSTELGLLQQRFYLKLPL